MILVDTNVLLDLVTDDPDWAEWSLARLEEAALAGPILINDIVYAETSIRYHRIEDLDAMLAQAMIEIAATPRSALFLAGKAFQRVPYGWRHANRGLARLFHRRSRGGRRLAAAHARRWALSQLLSEGRADRTPGLNKDVRYATTA